jgi:hypothetical protein
LNLAEFKNGYFIG